MVGTRRRANQATTTEEDVTSLNHPAPLKSLARQTRSSRKTIDDILITKDQDSVSSSVDHLQQLTPTSDVHHDHAGDQARDQFQSGTSPDLNHLDSGLRLSKYVMLVLTITSHVCMGFLIGYSIYEFGKSQLSGVLKTVTPTSAVVMGSWRVVYSLIGWYYNFDALSMVSVGLLSSGPALYLLTTFYDAPLLQSIALLFADHLVFWTMWRILTENYTSSLQTNALMTTDLFIQLSTTLLASSIYAVVLFLAFQTFAPMIVLKCFSGEQTIAAAYPLDYVSIIPVAIIFGYVLNSLVFTPYFDFGDRPEDRRISDFNPTSATLRETFVWNFWGYTARAKVGFGRILLATIASGIGSFSILEFGLETTKTSGAIAYSGIWVLAALLAGTALGLVGK